MNKQREKVQELERYEDRQVFRVAKKALEEERKEDELFHELTHNVLLATALPLTRTTPSLLTTTSITRSRLRRRPSGSNSSMTDSCR